MSNIVRAVLKNDVAVIKLRQGPKGDLGSPLGIDFISFLTTPDLTDTDQGDLYWDVDEVTLSLIQNGTVLQLGQEVQYNVRNNSGAEIADGTPVMATGTIGGSGRITIAPMDGTDYNNAKYYIGIATETIADNADGKVTHFGKIRGIDTSSFNDGDVLWIDPDTPGVLTNTEPDVADIGLPVAFVVNAASNGTLFSRALSVDIHHSEELHDQNAASKDPTGFSDNANIAVTYDNTTRRVTLTGTLTYYWQGHKKVLTSPWVSDQRPDSGDGIYFLSSSDGATFSWAKDIVWPFTNVQVAAVIVANSGADVFCLREVHGLMGNESHGEFHELLGTYRYSGLGPTAATYALSTATDDATRPGFDAGVIKDEDIKTTIPATLENTYTTMRVGVSGESVYDTAATFPFRASGGFILVNDPTDGSETTASNNRFVNVYEFLIPVAADTESQKYRRLMIQPQAQYTSLASAQAEDIAGIDLGDLGSPEYMFYTRLTYKTANGNGNTGKVTLEGISYITGSRASQVSVAGGANPTAENVPFTPSGTISSTNVQNALEELDNPPEVSVDVDSAGELDIDVNAGDVFVLDSDGTSFTITASNVPAAGERRAATLVINIANSAGTVPGITWTTLGIVNTAPDISAATTVAVIELAYLDGQWFASAVWVV